MKKKLLLTLFILSSCLYGNCQKEFNHWFFIGGSVDFNTSPPSGAYIQSGSMGPTSMSISDKKNGALLFYNFGNLFFDRQHFKLPSSTAPNHTLGGGDLSLPSMKDDDLYGIFSFGNYLRFQLLDMRLNGGRGDLVSGSLLQLTSTGQISFCLSGYRQVNNRSHWLITHGVNGGTLSAFAFDGQYLDTIPKVFSPAIPDTLNTLGQAKFSPNGRKFAVAINPRLGPRIRQKFALLILDFDHRSGTFSNPIRLPEDSTIWGVEFSPNSKYLYYAKHDSLFQLDVTTHDSSTISSSKYLVKKINLNDKQFGQLQLAPDGTIYVAVDNPYESTFTLRLLKPYLSQIKYPDSAKSSCMFRDTGIVLTGISNPNCTYALPDIHGSFYRPLKFENTCDGEVFHVTITDTISLDSSMFDFGEPSSGSRNLGHGVADTHTYSQAGDYLLTTIMYYTDLNGNVQIDSLFDSIYIIQKPMISVMATSDSMVCIGDSLSTNISNTSEYQVYWYDSSEAPYHAFDSAGTYWVKAINHCGVDSFNFTVGILNRHLTLHSDTVLCLGDSLQLAITDTLASYRWSNGSVDSSIWISGGGTYWGEMTNACGSFADTVLIVKDSIPNPSLGKDTTLCKDALYFLDVTRSPLVTPTSYLWNSGFTFPLVKVLDSGWVWVKETNWCGVGSDSVHVSYLPPPSFSIVPDSAFCKGDSIELSFSKLKNSAGIGDIPKFLWSNGSKDSTTWVNDFGWVWLQLTNQCGVGVDSILVSELPKPAIPFSEDTILCGKARLVLDATNPLSTYLWQGGFIDPANPVQEVIVRGLYAVTVTNPCGEVSGSVRVVYQEVPTLSLASEPNEAVCEPTPIKIKALASGEGLIYKWNTGDTTGSLTVNQPGTFSLTVTNHCGQASASIVPNYVMLKAGFTLEKTEGEAPFNVVSQNASVGAKS
ncbi:MAG: PKD domain-containing protein, partial [Flavobacteriales bacterium]|nr:PKD domain-containing protein [Flavobacteriales bacterium]